MSFTASAVDKYIVEVTAGSVSETREIGIVVQPHQHVYQIYYDADLNSHQYCSICEPRTIEELRMDASNYLKYAQHTQTMSYRAMAVSLDDPASLLLRSISKGNKEWWRQAASYAYKTATFQWSDVVEKAFQDSPEVKRIKREAAGTALASMLKWRKINAGATMDTEEEQMLFVLVGLGDLEDNETL